MHKDSVKTQSSVYKVHYILGERWGKLGGWGVYDEPPYRRKKYVRRRVENTLLVNCKLTKYPSFRPYGILSSLLKQLLNH